MHIDEKPAPDIVGRAAKRAKPNPWLLERALKGLTELELFDSTAQRRQALHEVARIGSKSRHLLRWLMLWPLCMTVFWAVGLVSNRWLPPPLARTCQGAAGVLAVFIAFYVLDRYRLRRPLRQNLLDYGIPVCIDCGYSLHGLTPATERCPECGRSFSQRVNAILKASSQ